MKGFPTTNIENIDRGWTNRAVNPEGDPRRVPARIRPARFSGQARPAVNQSSIETEDRTKSMMISRISSSTLRSVSLRSVRMSATPAPASDYLALFYKYVPDILEKVSGIDVIATDPASTVA